MCGTSETQELAEQVRALAQAMESQQQEIRLLKQRERERRAYDARVQGELSASHQRLTGAESAGEAHVREEAARLQADAIALSASTGGQRRQGRPDLRSVRRSA